MKGRLKGLAFRVAHLLRTRQMMSRARFLRFCEFLDRV